MRGEKLDEGRVVVAISTPYLSSSDEDALYKYIGTRLDFISKILDQSIAG